MSNVTLEIGGRAFAVSCADGEEPHIAMLGRMIDERARKIGSTQGEARTLLFAALMLADELHEAHRNAPPPGASAPVAITEDHSEVLAVAAQRVDAIATRIENLAAALEHGPSNA